MTEEIYKHVTHIDALILLRTIRKTNELYSKNILYNAYTTKGIFVSAKNTCDKGKL